MAINPEMEVNAGPNASQKRARALRRCTLVSSSPLPFPYTPFFLLSLSPSRSLSLFPVFCVAGDTGNKKEACPPPSPLPRMFKRGPRSRARNQLLGNDFLSRTTMKLLVLSQRPLRSLRIVSGIRSFFFPFFFFFFVPSEHPVIQR